MEIFPLGDFIDISIPLRFDGVQPNVYGVDPAASRPCEYGDFVGDTRRGGSVNFEQYTFIPHCNGTHTECVGHVTDERISVPECLDDVFMNAVLVTVEPENAVESGETYPYGLAEADMFISGKSLKERITPEGVTLNRGRTTHDPRPSTLNPRPTSLIVRTLPNDDTKLTRKYDKPVPPFFSNEAISYVVEAGFKHLLVDLPSIDRLYDDGKLSNHRIFWNVEAGSKTVNPDTRGESTITELIYVPEVVRDGSYILNLQIAPFASDAAPSRPILMPSNNEKGRPF